MLHQTAVPHSIPAIMFEGPGVRIPSKYKNRTKIPTMQFLRINHPSLPPTPTNFFVFLVFFVFCFLSTDCSKLRQTMQIDVLFKRGAPFRRPRRGSGCG